MNSTPSRCSSIMRLTAFPPPPPTPTTFIRAACDWLSSNSNIIGCETPALQDCGKKSGASIRPLVDKYHRQRRTCVKKSTTAVKRVIHTRSQARSFMIFSQCARRTTLRLTSLHGVGGGGPLRRYARLVGAPNYAPSLRSVAGLLLALALQSACEDTLTSLHRFVTAGALCAAGWALRPPPGGTGQPSFARRAPAQCGRESAGSCSRRRAR